MDKLTFNKLDILSQLEYINNTLAKGESLRTISTKLAMSKTTIRDRFIKHGYVFNKELKQYKKDNEYKDNTSIFPDNIKKDKKPGEVKKYKENTNILQLKNINNKIVVPKDEYKENANIFKDNEINEKILRLVPKYTDIEEMLTWYNNQKNIVEAIELKINSDRLTGDVKTTTIRLYTDVWSDFREFSEKFKEYKSMDLVSMALVEYMDKYK